MRGRATNRSTRLQIVGMSRPLKPPQFKPYGPGSTPPNQGPSFGAYGNTPNQLRLGLLDPKLRFLHRIPAPLDGPDPLIGAVQEWLGGTNPISVLDFSGVHTHAADVAVGTVMTLLFELAIRSNPEGPGIGRPQPSVTRIRRGSSISRRAGSSRYSRRDQQNCT